MDASLIGQIAELLFMLLLVLCAPLFWLFSLVNLVRMFLNRNQGELTEQGFLARKRCLAGAVGFVICVAAALIVSAARGTLQYGQ